MAQTVLGTNDFTEQPQQDSYQIGEGRTTTKEWHGPRDLYEVKWAEVEASKPDRMTGSKGTPAIINATYLPTDPPDDEEAIWELIPSPVDRPLSSHPAFNITPSQLGWTEKIDKAIREGRGHETDWDVVSGSQNLNDYRNLKAKGTDSYRMWSYTVRKTLVTSLAGVDKFEDRDAGFVVPWSQIGIPSTVKFSQPVWNKWDGTDLETLDINEWLISPATVRYERGKYSIVKEWYGAMKWYKILYNVFQGGGADTDTDGSNLG